MTFKLKNKSKVDSQDWILRLSIDSIKTQEDYFKYYPQLDPRQDTFDITICTVEFMANMHVMMTPDVQRAGYQQCGHHLNYLHTIYALQGHHHLNSDNYLDMMTTFLSSDSYMYNNFGLAMFNTLDEENRHKALSQHKKFSDFSMARLALHNDVTVKKYISKCILRNKKAVFIDILAYNHQTGISSSGEDELIDSFIHNFLYNKIKISVNNLALLKKHAQVLKTHIDVTSPVLKKIRNDYQRYALKILASKDINAAVTLLPNMPNNLSACEILQLGDALILRPEAAHLRKRLYQNILPHHDVSASINDNQIRIFARLFYLIASTYPDEWKQFCAQIEQIHLFEYIDYKTPSFERNGVNAILFSHIMYKTPVYGAKEELVEHSSMYLIEELFKVKECKNIQHSIEIAKTIHAGEDDRTLAKNVWDMLINDFSDMTEEIDINFDF